jgi:PTS system nitrogen regulatory IIA component
MKLASLLTLRRIGADLEAATKADALDALARLATSDLAWADAREVARQLAEREAIASTGIGEGLAVPHASYERSPEMTLALARSKAGVPFEAIDGKPVHLFFVLLVPTDQPGPHLKTLARLSKVLKSQQTRTALLTAPDVEGMFDALVAADEALG